MFQAERQDLYFQFFIQLACLQHLYKENGGKQPVLEQPGHRALRCGP